MIDENGPRRRDLSHDVVNRADDQSRDAMAFDHMGDETDGLVAEGSIGNKQSQGQRRLASTPEQSPARVRFQPLDGAGHRP